MDQDRRDLAVETLDAVIQQNDEPETNLAAAVMLDFLRDALRSDGPRSEAIREALGLSWNWQYLDRGHRTGWSDSNETSATCLRDEFGYKTRRRIAGEWQDAPA